MQRHAEYTRERIRQLSSRMRERIYFDRKPVTELTVAGPAGRISFAEAQKLKSWRKVNIGDQFGPLWATYWFQGRANVPRAWLGGRVDLIWVSHSEATLWLNGKTAQGLNHEPSSTDRSARSDAVLKERAAGGEIIPFHVEMACNRVFGRPGKAWPIGQNVISPFVFERCDIVLFDPEAWELYFDYFTLVELEAEVTNGLDPTFAGELLRTLNEAANVYEGENRSTWKIVRELIKPLYSRRNATTAHELSAIGHAHVDTAWLWPIAETDRKCERTFSSQLAYMREYPEFKFACSQAYQFTAIKNRNPELYGRIKTAVKAGQFVPVGGSWIEPDCNIPSGESLIRQMLYGQRFFEREFGIRCKEFWNPDVFGYNGQLPQIMRLMGMTRFLTQKLAYNRFTSPLYHTFDWEGIDGSRVLAHFPPADTYNAMATVAEMRLNVRNYKDHDRSKESYMLFGFGDGGGGPTRQMIETIRRAKNLQGLPRVTFRSADEFFTRLERDVVDRPVMVGELYFELHRGTYTTQAATKKSNRQCEFLLHDIEFLFSVLRRMSKKIDYPRKELDRIWKLLLLNQFHDILPGSSITVVYEDAAKDYAEIRRTGEKLLKNAVTAYPRLLKAPSRGITPLNTTGFDRREVVSLPDGSLAVASTPSYGVGEIMASTDTVQLETNRDELILQNQSLRAVFGNDGTLRSLVEKTTDREALTGPGNLFQLFDDYPTVWDAWDIDLFHLETMRPCKSVSRARVVTDHPLRKEVAFEYAVGNRSHILQTVRLDALSRRLEFHCKVDWLEDRKILKVAFSWNVRAMNATYEMQFGCVERPTHYNTLADLAKFEVCGHMWADLSESGFGVAMLSDCKYGWSTYGNLMRLSLLRAPAHPDPTADRGIHEFAFAVMPHKGSWRDAGVVAEGFRFNSPLRFVPGKLDVQSFVSIDDPNVVIDTVKLAEDSDAIIVRLYECHGARGRATLTLNLPFKRVHLVNGLEEPIESISSKANQVQIEYQPFKIISLRFE